MKFVHLIWSNLKRKKLRSTLTLLGAKIKVGQNDWAEIGVFSANGAIAESEIWTDAPVLQAACQRDNSFQSVCVKLTSAGAFQEFKDALTTDPRLNAEE